MKFLCLGIQTRRTGTQYENSTFQHTRAVNMYRLHKLFECQMHVLLNVHLNRMCYYFLLAKIDLLRMFKFVHYDNNHVLGVFTTTACGSSQIYPNFCNIDYNYVPQVLITAQNKAALYDEDFQVLQIYQIHSSLVLLKSYFGRILLLFLSCFNTKTTLA